MKIDVALVTFGCFVRSWDLFVVCVYTDQKKREKSELIQTFIQLLKMYETLPITVNKADADFKHK